MKRLCLVGVLIAAVYFRFTGINWDAGQHLHPDERFLTMVALDLKWPVSLSQYLDTAVSPSNPHNAGHEFFVYGTYPVLLTKAVADLFRQSDYSGLTLVGRNISAFLDLGIVLLVYALSLHLFNRFRVACLSALVYALSVLPIQLSHFFANDTFLVFFLTLTLYLLVSFYKKPSHRYSFLMGISFGLAFSAKINAVLILPVILLTWFILLVKKYSFSKLFLYGIVFLISVFISVRLAYPYLFSGLFSLNPKLLANWADLQRLGKPDYYFPPSIQWINITPVLFPLRNLIYWGLGLPLAVVSLLSLVYFIIKYKKSYISLSLIIFVSTVFIYQSLQSAQPLRYYYPIYPILAVISGWLLSKIKHNLILLALIPVFLIYTSSFVNIYKRPHTRVSASNWIYDHIPAGSVLSCEYWDDCLPLIFPDHPVNPYQVITIAPYDQESPSKWQGISQKLSTLDYLVITSNRLYGSISSVPGHYPQTSSYYQLLFSGKLGFTPVAQFTSRPSSPLPFNLCLNPRGFTYGRVSSNSSDCAFAGLSFVDDYADETFTVYDHPKVTIFQNTVRYSPSQLYALIFSKT